MHLHIPYGKHQLDLQVPDSTTVYRTAYEEPAAAAHRLVEQAIRQPIGSPALQESVRHSGARSVVIVVSDITRPIPYVDFIGSMLAEIEAAGVPRAAITLLIATGMHRPSTAAERLHMFGKTVCDHYCIIDHEADKREDLVTLPCSSHAGRPIELNRHFMAADYRIVTGLVEPHFMAGFSGGRKAVCPGLCSLETVKAFHSFAFLNHPSARNAHLGDNPLHAEALSIALAAQVHFCLNVVVDKQHRVVAAFAGELEAVHQAACTQVGKLACPTVADPVDVVITSCGGHPLDTTFYQCVKGMVSCLPAVKTTGIVVALGSCTEGIGGSEYVTLMHEFAGRWREFLSHRQASGVTTKDQWQFQMQTKTLQHVGDGNLRFITDGLDAAALGKLNVTGIPAPTAQLQACLQAQVDSFIRAGLTLAVIPEGPYCAPVRGC